MAAAGTATQRAGRTKRAEHADAGGGGGGGGDHARVHAPSAPPVPGRPRQLPARAPPPPYSTNQTSRDRTPARPRTPTPRVPVPRHAHAKLDDGGDGASWSRPAGPGGRTEHAARAGGGVVRRAPFCPALRSTATGAFVPFGEPPAPF
ncbi:hypothetical protein PVAP13_4KG314205 [Panicum virgatum]|uniref:Uncharacterized protein n=1 Tax=Panicum virgatum TaxID=38727 RepID=A0A8T0TP40_PANVG|nr:hypothetical protein PVAP13_4KG314205 [Panicum virgatum]